MSAASIRPVQRRRDRAIAKCQPPEKVPKCPPRCENSATRTASWSPKLLLAQVGMTDEAEIKVENGAIVLRAAKRTPRAGWAEASEAVAAGADEGLAWPEFVNEGDGALRW